MILREISLKDSFQNILLDDVFLSMAEQDQNSEMLRFWDMNPYCIVCGRLSNPNQDLHLERIRENHIEIIRRSSGGGTVLLGPGCLNFSLVMDKSKNKNLFDIGKSYRFILSRVVDILNAMDIKAQFFPLSDLALTETRKKFSGNAQRRRKRFLLHHGTLLFRFNLKAIDLYLKNPVSQPDYRAGRTHHQFVTNIDIDIEVFKKKMCESFGVSKELHTLTLKEQNLLQTVYNSRKILKLSDSDCTIKEIQTSLNRR